GVDATVVTHPAAQPGGADVTVVTHPGASSIGGAGSIGGMSTAHGSVEPARILSLSGEGGGWEPGARLGELTLMAKLGQGGMGVVYLARNAAGAEVAVKALALEAGA